MKKSSLLFALIALSRLSFSQVFLDNFGTQNSGNPPDPFINPAAIVASGITNNGWTGGNNFFTGNPGGAYAYQANSAGQSGVTITLSLNVANDLDITSIQFDARSSTQGPDNVTVDVNGINVGSSSVSRSSTLWSNINLAAAINDLSGQVSVNLVYSGANPAVANWTTRIDNFQINGVALPIELISFTGKLQQRVVVLNWRTATETSNDFFSIERSADGRHFTETGRVQGSGTTAEPQDYRFTDDNPLPGLNYYRLRQVDFDGQFSYSKVVSVRVGETSGARLYPSPATEFLTLQMEKPAAENTVWEIFDLAGRLLQSGEFLAENPDFQINVAALPEGLYHLRLSAGQSVSTLRFLKN